MQEVTGTEDLGEARSQLENHGWDLEAAVQTHLALGDNRAPTPPIPAQVGFMAVCLKKIVLVCIMLSFHILPNSATTLHCIWSQFPYAKVFTIVGSLNVILDCQFQKYNILIL